MIYVYTCSLNQRYFLFASLDNHGTQWHVQRRREAESPRMAQVGALATGEGDTAGFV